MMRTILTAAIILGSVIPPLYAETKEAEIKLRDLDISGLSVNGEQLTLTATFDVKGARIYDEMAFDFYLLLTPRDAASGSYRVWYIPEAVPLVDDTDTIQAYNGFESFLIIDVAIWMLSKEESDPSFLMMERQREDERLKQMLIDRDIGESDRIEESDSNEESYW